ncbi:MAG: NmrA family NAD(P)-binding protein [Gammaproteobacteria bacterium]|nr:NmrA family NAD(P)-binding protein [Gammaproteobacteria bacterium]
MSAQPELFLIPAATGNVAGACAAYLTGQRPDGALRLTSHREEGCAELRRRFPGAEVMQADFTDATSLAAACDGCHGVFMNVPDMMPEPDATGAMLAALSDTAAPDVFLLRFGAYPTGRTVDQLTPETRDSGIGAAKHLRARAVLERSHIHYVLLNAPCWFMTNLLWLAAPGVRDRDELVIPCRMSTAFIDPRDIGAAAGRIMLDPALRTPGREHQVNGPEELDFDQVAQALSELLGREIRHNDDLEVFRRYFGDATDMMASYFRHSPADYTATVTTHELDALLGRPPVDLASWLSEHRAAFT